MATIPNVSSGSGIISANGTRFTSFGDNTSGSFGSTESTFQQTLRSAGKSSGLYVRVILNSLSAASTVRTRKNTANGGQSVSIPAPAGVGATGEFLDTSGTDTIAATDIFNYQIVTGSTGTSWNHSVIATNFSATVNTRKRLCCLSSGGTTYNTASTTFYNRPSGVMTPTATSTESQEQFKFQTGATVRNAFVRVLTNARTNSSTVGSRIDTGGGAANGNLSVSIGSAATGLFEDSSSTDTVNSGDKFDWAITLGTTSNNLVINIIACDIETTNGSTQNFLSTATGAGTVQNANATRSESIQGIERDTTTESDTQIQISLAAAHSNLTISVTANTVSVNSTLSFRRNSANGNQSVSITASMSGLFTDSTNVDYPLTSDEINTQIVTPNSGTSLTWAYIGMKSSFYNPGKIVSVNQAVNRASTY